MGQHCIKAWIHKFEWKYWFFYSGIIILFFENADIQIFEFSSFDLNNVGKTILVNGSTKSEYNNGVSLNGGHIMIDPPKQNCEELLSWWLTNPSTISIRLIIIAIHLPQYKITMYLARWEQAPLVLMPSSTHFLKLFHFNWAQLVQPTIKLLQQYVVSGVFLKCDYLFTCY